MKARLLNLWNHPLVHAGILISFCFILYFVNLGQWDLWNPDEPRYAQVAREMVQRKDWILMHFNGEIYADKPPLFFWLIALSSYIWNGFNSFSVRFPSAVFGTLTVILTFLIGAVLYNYRTGFLAGMILATSFEFAYISTRANIDATLTFFITLSLLCFVKWHKNTTPTPFPQGERGDQKPFIIYGFYVGIAMATLAKGPVGFILPLLVSLTFLIILKDWNAIKQMKLVWGMTLFIIIVLAWYVPALLKGGKPYFNETIMLHTVNRFAKGSSHIRPFYYYLLNFPIDFLPWIFFLPAAIIYGFSTVRLGSRREFLFLFFWTLIIFIFFSFSKGKRGLYLLPLFPAVSLMVGKWWDDYISSSIPKINNRWFSIPYHILLGLLLGLGIGINWVVLNRLPNYINYSLPIGFLLVGGSITLFILQRLKYGTATFFLLIWIMAGGFFYTSSVIFPLVNPYKSARFISQEITSRIKPDEKLLAYGDFVIAPYLYYTGIIPIIEINKKEELLSFLKSERRVFCLMKFRDFKQFQTIEIGKEIKLITRRIVGGDDMVLISNK